MTNDKQKLDGLEAALCEVLSAQVESLRRENLTLRAKNAELIGAMQREVNGYDALTNATVGGECPCPDCWCHSGGDEPERGKRSGNVDALGLALIVTVAILLLNFLGCFRVTVDTDVVGADEAYHRAQGRY